MCIRSACSHDLPLPAGSWQGRRIRRRRRVCSKLREEDEEKVLIDNQQVTEGR
jgi:hypothetical protein